MPRRLPILILIIVITAMTTAGCSTPPPDIKATVQEPT